MMREMRIIFAGVGIALFGFGLCAIAAPWIVWGLMHYFHWVESIIGAAS